MKTISSYKPKHQDVNQTRVLLLGPVGSGKSSFISSVQSVFNGRVINRAMVGTSPSSFTKRLQSYNIQAENDDGPTGLVLCDIMGLRNEDMTGLTLHDILSVIKGHVPEGHKFRPDQPVTSDTEGYLKWPELKDKIHCVVFVVDGSTLNTFTGFKSNFQQLREHISDLGIHQVALLTHIDKICPDTQKDASAVYSSVHLKQLIANVATLLGMSTSYVIPVKNYAAELNLDTNTDVLLLSAVDHILQYADLYLNGVPLSMK